MNSSIHTVLKALGDDTRYAIFEWLRDAPGPATVAEVAQAFDLHANTVRPHLDRLREAGLVELDDSPQGTVGRPQHRYTAVKADIEFHRGPDEHKLLAEMLAEICCRAQATSEQAYAVGEDAGRRLVIGETADVAAVLTAESTRLGFGAVADDGCVRFTDCPFRTLAEAHPDIICSLHHGLTVGVAESVGGSVAVFHRLDDRRPCAVEVGA